MENSDGHLVAEIQPSVELVGFDVYSLLIIIVSFSVILTVLAVRDLRRLSPDAFDDIENSEEPYLFVPLWY